MFKLFSEKYFMTPNYPNIYPLYYDKVNIVCPTYHICHNFLVKWICLKDFTRWLKVNFQNHAYHKILHLQTWQLQSTNGQPITLTFDSFDVSTCRESPIDNVITDYCSCDYVEIDDGSGPQRFCGPFTGLNGTEGQHYYNGEDGAIGTSIPGPFTSNTTITVRFSSNYSPSPSSTGFLAVVCCSVNVTTTDGVSNNTSSLYFRYVLFFHFCRFLYATFTCSNNFNTTCCHHRSQWQCY